MSKSSKRRRKQQREEAERKLLQKQAQEQQLPQLAPAPPTQQGQISVEFPWPKRLLRHPLVAWIHHPLKLFLAVVAALSGLISLYVFFYQKVSIESGPSLDSTNPFKTQFIVRNEGNFKISDCKGWFIWTFNNPSHGLSSGWIGEQVPSAIYEWHTGDGFIQESNISPSATSTLQLHPHTGMSIIAPPGPIALKRFEESVKSNEGAMDTNAILMQISCFYKPWLWHKMKNQSFSRLLQNRVIFA
jgi:hypothetical protein